MTFLRILFFGLVFIISAVPVAAQKDFSERKRLYDLMEERKKNFSNYLESLEKKSGIFGGRTKNDMRASIEVLKAIVETDNKIISVLNRAIDFKVYEKTKTNYDRLDTDKRLINLIHASDTLLKQVNFLKQELSKSESVLRKQRVYIVLLLIGLAFCLICFYYKQRKT